MSGPREEELLTGPRLPRWLPWGGGGLLAVVLIAVLALNLGKRDPSTTPTSTAPTDSGSAAPATLEPPDPIDDAPVELPFAEPPSDVVAAGRWTFTLVGHNLTRIGTSVDRLRTNGFTAAVVDGLTAAVARASQLEVDPATHRIWIVPMGVPKPVVRVFDTGTLAQVGSAHRTASITGAAALDGALYVAGSGGLARITQSGKLTTYDAWNRRVFSVAADPGRHRLDAIVASTHGIQFAAYSGAGAATFTATPRGLVKGQVVVAGSGEIWLAGFGQTGAVLDRMDEALQHVVAFSNLASTLSPGAEVLASGANSLLVHTAGATSELWCTDAETGSVAQSWQVTASRAASAHGRAFALDDSGLVRLSLAGHCTG